MSETNVGLDFLDQRIIQAVKENMTKTLEIKLAKKKEIETVRW